MKDIIFDILNTHRDFFDSVGRKAAFSAALLFTARILVWIIGKLLRRAAARIPRFDETFASMLRIVISYAVFIICIIMILDVFGVNTTSLIALLGAAGVAVGLALKDTLSNIAAGIILLLLRSYRRGDTIEFGAFSGTVKEMDLFTTTLETADGIFISAPNGAIWGVPLKNYTRNGRRRMELVVGVSYSDSIDTAFEVMRQIAAEETRFLPEPAPQVMVQSLGDSCVNIMLRAWTHTDAYWPVFWQQTRNIKEKIEAAGLSIPFPQRDVHIKKDSAD
ncbi:MAG: mechanosensitive ion channel [Spirochaetales bacterium]|jgi:small conductance mechanosensitive channel|nr:mechanosensitive ion channel [Spirochaetales bacterium]